MTTVAYYDTCAVVDLVEASVHQMAGPLLKGAIKSAVGGDAIHVYHPLTLAEVATKMHDIVLASDAWRRGQQRASEPRVKQTLATFGVVHRSLASAASVASDAKTLEPLLGYSLRALLVPSESITRMASARARADHVRCTAKSRALPVGALADHQILQAAVDLRDAGRDVVFLSSDAESLGAADGLGLRWFDTKQRAQTPGWKDCPKDGSCWLGARRTPDCTRFAVAPQQRATTVAVREGDDGVLAIT